MQIHESIEAFNINSKTVVTIGTFDGVHLGHQQILKTLTEEAQRIKGESVLLTFHPHPRDILNSKNNRHIGLLQTLIEKQEKLEKYKLKHLVIQPFNKSFSTLLAKDFIEKVLVEKLHVNTIIIGYDHRFGYNREGDINLLKNYENQGKFKIIEINAVDIEEIKVSSTKIREALKEGNLEVANLLLNDPYVLGGVVVHGRKKGREIGFKTANIGLLNNKKIVPGNGVYFVHFNCFGKKYDGVCNIGIKPTFNENKAVSIEVHLLDFDKEIYAEEASIRFLKFHRKEKKFSNLEELKNQIKKDVTKARAFFKI